MFGTGRGRVKLSRAVIAAEKRYGAGLVGGEPPRVTATLNLVPGTLEGAHVAALVRAGLGFEPGYVRSEALFKRGGTFKPERHLAKLERAGPLRGSFDLEGTGDGRFWIVDGHPPRTQTVFWQVHDAAGPPPASLARLLAVDGLTFGYAAHADDEAMQSADSSNRFQNRRRPWKHLPHAKDPDLPGLHRIDVSRNPGRRTAYPGMWLTSAWRMWFGPAALALLDREAIRSFRDARRIEELDAGVLFVELYEDPASAALPAHREIQRAFRAAAGIDALEVGAAEAVAAHRAEHAQRHVVIAAPPTDDEAPRPFGYKNDWIAVRGDDPRALAGRLGLADPREASWREGLERAYAARGTEVFVAPPLDGWLLVVGTGIGAEDEAALRAALAPFAARLGDFRWFGTHRIVDYHAWATVAGGELVRAYGFLGERGELLFDVGSPTAAELEAGLFETEDDPEDEIDARPWSPTEESVMELAAASSVSPAAITPDDAARGPGILGRLPPTPTLATPTC